jgi:TrmH family RNA methyltransferase
MLTAHTIKVLQSLDKKKFRQKYNLFLVEGNKIICELFNSNFKVKEILSTDPQKLDRTDIPVTHISENELKKSVFLKPQKILLRYVIWLKKKWEIKNPACFGWNSGSWKFRNDYPSGRLVRDRTDHLQ